MSRTRLTDRQQGFGGGLNTVADESQLQPSQIRTGRNARLTEQNAARKRYGTKRYHSSALAGGATVMGGYGWQLTSSVEELAVANGTLYTGNASFGMVWTARAGALDSSVYPSFAAFRDVTPADVVYIADGGALNKWNGSALTADIASTPSVSFVTVHNRRLFGISGTDDTLYWSALDNGDTLGIAASDGGEAIIRTFGDQKIVALASFRASLFIFHTSGISRFTGWSQDDINIQAGTSGISGDVGTVAPRSVVAVENGVLFLSDRGIYAANENGVEPVSVPVEIQFTGLTTTQLTQVCSVHNRAKREVWFFIPGSGVYVYNYRTGAWVGPWDGGYTSETTDTHSMWESADSTGLPTVHVGDYAGYVKKADVASIYLDDVLYDGTGGTAYTLSVKCHRMFCGDIANEKSFRWAYLLADADSSDGLVFSWSTRTESGSYTIESSSAWGSGEWGSGTWGGEGVVPFRIPIHGRGGYIDITITDTGERSPLFSQVEVEGFDMGRRGS